MSAMTLFSKKITWGVVVRDVFAIVLMYLAGIVFLPRTLLLELLNGVLSAICLSVVVVYTLATIPDLINSRLRIANGVTIIRLCIVGAWSFQLWQAIGRIYFLEFHPEVPGRTFDASLGVFGIGYIIFAAGHLIAIGMIETNQYVRTNVCIVLWSILAGIFGTLAMHYIHGAL